MAEILMKAGSFIAIIILGYVLRRRGFFKEEDFYVLSRIVLKITLPAAIVTNFTGIDMKPSMLLMSLLGLGGGIILTGMAFLISAGKNGEEKAFNIINLTGYNIGNFTMPFAQSFLGPLGVVATSLFDSGNALVCLGGTYSVAVMAKGEKGKFSIMPIIKTLLSSVPFDAYLLMTVLSLLHLSLPAPMVSFTGIIANGNAFMAMLMLGVVCTAAGYILYFRLIADIGPLRSLSVTFLIPPFAVLWGYLFLGEIVESGLILGALLVCVALWMMVVPSGRKERVPGGA